jgi:hypothetical protein
MLSLMIFKYRPLNMYGEVKVKLHSSVISVLDGGTEQVHTGVTVLTCIQEVPGSNLDRNTDYTEGFRYFAQSLQRNAS